MIGHSSDLLILKSVADDQAYLSEQVKKQNAKFDLMLQEYQENQLANYTKKEHFTKAFGEPVFIQMAREGDEHLEEWLYRYSTQFFNSPKIYVYFDRKGRKFKVNYESPGNETEAPSQDLPASP